MVLSNADKKEIVAMFQAFSERLTTGQQSRPVERFVYDVTTGRIIPAIEGAAQTLIQAPPIGIQRPEDILLGQALETAFIPTRRKKAMTKFNRAVKEGMKIIKASTSYGKKGTISSPKKAFSAVTKAVSKVSKAQKAGKKKPKSGNVVIKKVLSAAAKIIEKRGIKTYRKRYGLPKRRKTPKDYRDYDPQGTMFD